MQEVYYWEQAVNNNISAVKCTQAILNLSWKWQGENKI